MREQGVEFGLDCNMTRSGYFVWPESVAVYTYGGMTFSVACNNESKSDNASIALTSCPYPMALVADPSPYESPCQMKCPLPIFPISEYVLELNLLHGLSWISLIGSLFVLVSYVVLKDFPRGVPRKKFLWQIFPIRFQLVLSCFMMSIAILIGPLGGMVEFLCHDGKPSTQDYPPCGAQGILVFFFGSAMGTWWISLVVNIYLSTQKLRLADKKHAQKYYAVFGWGFPIVALIITLARTSFGFFAPNAICFLPDDGEGETITNVVFLGPLGVYIAIGILLIVKVLIEFRQQERSAKLDLSEATVKIYVKFFSYVLILIFYCIIILVNRFYLTEQRNHIATEFEDWVKCHVSEYTSGNFTGKCGDNSNVISTWPLRMEYIAMALPGTVMFLFFGIERNLRELWAQFVIAHLLPATWQSTWQVKSEKPYPLNLKNRTTTTSSGSTLTASISEADITGSGSIL